MRNFLLVLFLILLVIGAYFAWNVFMPNTNLEGSTKFLYIRTGKATKEDVMKTIKDSNYLKSPGIFEFVAGKMDVWDRLKPGRYEIDKGTSVLDLVRKLRNGNQSDVNLTITKIRTKEQLASLIGKRFETDSATMMSYLNSPDSLKNFGFDSNTVMAAVFPDTYTYRWTASPSVIFSKLHDQYEKIWNDERKNKATTLGLDPVKAYTLASIIEEETNIQEDKPLMASVYLNRLNKGMRLGADPTVKFALKDFDLRRIYQKHLQTNSPYN
ncbi:MAG: endolytic transglycosylase MltG, partial [Flavitalea sp.]